MSRQEAKLFLAPQKGGTPLANATLHTNILAAEFAKFGYGIATRANGQVYVVQMFSN